MSDFLPRFFPADIVTRTTSAAVTAGQLVYVTGADTVGPTSAACMAFGVAAEDDPVGGNAIQVFRVGVHVLTASGPIAAGDPVVPAAAGAVATIGSDTNYTHVVGQALAAASGGAVEVALRIA